MKFKTKIYNKSFLKYVKLQSNLSKFDKWVPIWSKSANNDKFCKTISDTSDLCTNKSIIMIKQGELVTLKNYENGH